MQISTLYRRASLLAVTGLLALAGPAWPAFADQSGSAGQDGNGAAASENITPPPMADSEIDGYRAELSTRLHGLDPKPPKPYQPAKQCVQHTPSTSIVDSVPWGQKVMRLKELWSFGNRGQGANIGVIDTGVTQHPRFDGRMHTVGDYVNQTDNGGKDCDGHGTIVAGIIGADSQSGFSGVAPQSTIYSIRTTSTYYQAQDANSSDSGPKTPGDLETMAAAIYTLIDNYNVKTINVSLAACTPVSTLSTPGGAKELKFIEAAVKYAVKKGVVIVAAAGNVDSKSACSVDNAPGKIQLISAPAFFDGDVLSVGSVGQSGDASSFTMSGPWVDVAAPGENIVSLDPTGQGLANQEADPQNKISGIQGTSFASPYVTGLVALVQQRYPQLSAHQVMHRIIATAQHPAGDNGRNDRVGYGLVDPVAAMTAVLPEEHGRQEAPVGVVHRPLPPAPVEDQLPIMVALIGAGAGLGLLGLTLFIVYTVQRNRRPRRVA